MCIQKGAIENIWKYIITARSCQTVWWTKYKELTHFPAVPTLPLQEINIASLINKVNGKKVASTRGKKEKASIS
jgi:hypothetical protein